MYHKILFAVDFGDAAYAASQKVKKIAEKLQAKIHLIHVVEIPVIDLFPEIPNKEKLYLEESERRLAGIGKNLDIPSSQQFIEIGDPRVVIPEFIEKHKIDLLIVGHHEKKGIDRLLGSTAYALLAHAKYEVLVMPYSISK